MRDQIRITWEKKGIFFKNRTSVTQSPEVEGDYSWVNYSTVLCSAGLLCHLLWLLCALYSHFHSAVPPKTSFEKDLKQLRPLIRMFKKFF